jgi:hypothetical protein
MASHTVSLAVVVGVDTFNINQVITDAQARAVDEVLAPAALNTEVDIVLTRAAIKSIVITSIGGDLTIKTNSSGSPADTLVMTSGQVLEYCPSGTNIQAVGAAPFPTADVTKLFLSSTAGTTFKLRAVVTAANG